MCVGLFGMTGKEIDLSIKVNNEGLWCVIETAVILVAVNDYLCIRE